MEEIWKDIEGFPNYMVSNLGRFKSIDRYVISKNSKKLVRGKILKPHICKFGYVLVSLYNENGVHNVYGHRIVASHFIPNPENKLYVDHINTIRNDNRVENLRWTDAIENSNNIITKEHMSTAQKGKIGERHNASKIIYQYDTDGNLVKKWYGAREVERELNFKAKYINKVASGKGKTAYGYIWKYAS